MHHGARAVCSYPQLLQKEEHLQRVLAKCKYPPWLSTGWNWGSYPNQSCQKQKKHQQLCQCCIQHSVALHDCSIHWRAKWESKNVCSKHRVQVFFREGSTTRNLLVAPRNKDPITKKSGVIYRYKCDRVECDEEYLESHQEHLETGSKNTWRPPV